MKRLEDIDLEILKALISDSVNEMKALYKTNSSPFRPCKLGCTIGYKI